MEICSGARTKHNTDCYTIYADHGIGVVLKRENKNLLDLNNENFEKLKFQLFYSEHKKIMNILNINDFMKVLDNY